MGLKSLKMLIKSETSMVWTCIYSLHSFGAFGVGKSATGTAYFILELHPHGLYVINMFFFKSRHCSRVFFKKGYAFATEE